MCLIRNHLTFGVHLDPDEIESSNCLGWGLIFGISYSFKLQYSHIGSVYEREVSQNKKFSFCNISYVSQVPQKENFSSRDTWLA